MKFVEYLSQIPKYPHWAVLKKADNGRYTYWVAESQEDLEEWLKKEMKSSQWRDDVKVFQMLPYAMAIDINLTAENKE